jgi:hypothetical protein
VHGESTERRGWWLWLCGSREWVLCGGGEGKEGATSAVPAFEKENASARARAAKGAPAGSVEGDEGGGGSSVCNCELGLFAMWFRRPRPREGRQGAEERGGRRRRGEKKSYSSLTQPSSANPQSLSTVFTLDKQPTPASEEAHTVAVAERPIAALHARGARAGGGTLSLPQSPRHRDLCIDPPFSSRLSRGGAPWRCSKAGGGARARRQEAETRKA